MTSDTPRTPRTPRRLVDLYFDMEAENPLPPGVRWSDLTVAMLEDLAEAFPEAAAELARRTTNDPGDPGATNTPATED